ENPPSDLPVHSHEQPSMRPRRIRRGERERALATLSRVGDLQCGHAEFGVENANIGRGAGRGGSVLCGHAEFGVENGTGLRWAEVASQPFNAATPNSAWRTLRQTYQYIAMSNLQCGHAEFGVENERGPWPRCRGSATFNAATPNSAWRTRT